MAGLFSTLFVKLLGKRRHFPAAGLSITAIGAYTLLVGDKFSVIRLAVMSGLSLFD